MLDFERSQPDQKIPITLEQFAEIDAGLLQAEAANDGRTVIDLPAPVGQLEVAIGYFEGIYSETSDLTTRRLHADARQQEQSSAPKDLLGTRMARSFWGQHMDGERVGSGVQVSVHERQVALRAISALRGERKPYEIHLSYHD